MTNSKPASGVTFLRQAFAIGAFFALLPAVGGGGALGLPLVMALAALLAIGPQLQRQVFEKKPLSLGLLMALALWAAASSLWSPWEGQTALKVAATLGLGLLFASAAASPPLARLALAGAFAAVVVVMPLLAIEAFWDMPLNAAAQPGASQADLNQNPARGLVVMLALLWPALAWWISERRVPWRWHAAIAVLVAAGFMSLQFGQLSTAIGFGVGLVFFSFGFAAPRLAVIAPSIALAAWQLASPLLTPLLTASPFLLESIPHSWAVRIGIWRYTCAEILEQPWIGRGLDAARATTDYAIYDGERLRVIPVHPHSASLQLWYDLGLVGAVLAAALLALTGHRLGRAYATNRPAAAAAAAVLAMFGMMANVGWSLWQEWWMATLILAGALVCALGARDARA
ncbi:MAG: O-antigen ligase family protein [Hyphomonadaceae bacterium]